MRTEAFGLVLAPLLALSVVPRAFAADSVAPSSASGSGKWTSSPPKAAERPEDWPPLINALLEQKMNYGALASARAALKFFADLQTKEMAYRAIVRVVDLGYPFSTLADFVPGDLDFSGPAGREPFAQSYMLYKAMVNLEKKTPKWADYYFDKIDKENFSKYLFFRATEAYRSKKHVEAVGLLKRALAQISGPEQESLARKEARTLARIYYEAGQFEKSLEIYRTFLLKTNPLAPTDWLEAAWNEYKLKRFDDALGTLYNMESKAGAGAAALEKYVLRALIYREKCARDATDALIRAFNAEYGKTIDAIKLGEPLSKFPQLAKIDDPETVEFREIAGAVEELESESQRISSLPSKVRPIASFVYSAESTYLKRRRKLYEDKALESMARRLTIMGESLRFLRFEVERERFDPERVFAEAPPPETGPLIDGDEKTFRVHWNQWGDYWRDERLFYRGMITSKCDR